MTLRLAANNRRPDTNREQALADQLAQARRDQGILIRTVADKAGVAKITVMHWEQGLKFPCSFSRWADWAEALGAEFHVSVKTP